jgi:hypothetical protein
MRDLKKSLLLFLSSVLLAGALVGGSGASFAIAASAIKVKNVVLDQMAITIDPGTSANLHATVFPMNATNQKLVWASSNAKVVKVSKSGKVTAVKKGVATITVKSLDGQKKDTVKVNVANQTAEVKALTQQLIQAGVELNDTGLLGLGYGGIFGLVDAGYAELIYHRELMLPSGFVSFISDLNKQSKYTVKAVTMNGLTATVKVDATYYDASLFLAAIYTNAMWSMISYADNTDMSEEQLMEKMRQMMNEAIASQKATFVKQTKKATYTFELVQQGGIWTISNMAPAFIDSITCDYLKALSQSEEDY